jgi:hypothetical protein
MTTQPFSLKPFPTPKPPPDLHITGNIARYTNQLSLRYQVRGDVKQIVIPPLCNTPGRKNQLWENTCFEFFLGIKDAPEYWEFNLSPAGHWNVYHFQDYRQGMHPETAFHILPFSIEKQLDSLTLFVDVDLTKIIHKERQIEIAISTVIKDINSDITYWALAHPGQEADFHRRDSFMILLPIYK